MDDPQFRLHYLLGSEAEHTEHWKSKPMDAVYVKLEHMKEHCKENNIHDIDLMELTAGTNGVTQK